MKNAFLNTLIEVAKSKATCDGKEVSNRMHLFCEIQVEKLYKQFLEIEISSYIQEHFGNDTSLFYHGMRIHIAEWFGVPIDYVFNMAFEDYVGKTFGWDFASY